MYVVLILFHFGRANNLILACGALSYHNYSQFEYCWMFYSAAFLNFNILKGPIVLLYVECGSHDFLSLTTQQWARSGMSSSAFEHIPVNYEMLSQAQAQSLNWTRREEVVNLLYRRKTLEPERR